MGYQHRLIAGALRDEVFSSFPEDNFKEIKRAMMEMETALREAENEYPSSEMCLATARSDFGAARMTYEMSGNELIGAVLDLPDVALKCTNEDYRHSERYLCHLLRNRAERDWYEVLRALLQTASGSLLGVNTFDCYPIRTFPKVEISIDVCYYPASRDRQKYDMTGFVRACSILRFLIGPGTIVIRERVRQLGIVESGRVRVDIRGHDQIVDIHGVRSLKFENVRPTRWGCFNQPDTAFLINGVKPIFLNSIQGGSTVPE